MSAADYEGGPPSTASTPSAAYDAVIVGGSLAGCASAIMLARAGARVALVEQRPDPSAFKKICSHYIQASAVATLERLGLLEPMVESGALRSRARIWTRWGWIGAPAGSTIPSGVNMRRELLDPMIRAAAAEADGVDVFLAHTVQELLRDGGAVRGVRTRGADGGGLELEAALVVGADGRGSRVAKLAGVRERTVRHGRFAYGGYFEGPRPAHYPDAALWLLDPHMAACFPTDAGLMFYAVMPTMDLLERFRADPERELVEMVAGVPEAPPIRASRLVAPVQGKIDMTNVAHEVSAPGLALVGDAALAIDPLWGVGCGWALQSAEWLADSVAPALAASPAERAGALARGLRRYRRRHARGLRGHATMIYDYAGGRRLNPGERFLFSAAASGDARLAATFEAYGSRCIGPARMFASALPRATLVHARGLFGVRGGGPRALQAGSA
ncbi:MAG TPA: NAD(P)/FAD-dependent oxidoreductase [Solirubrobacteraceae bacterium]|nr:NAD(P)/FAD-dependent oxidoreductase [Solirubrobacteraceae bacterium]